MNLLFVSHLYPPNRLSGSEIYMHELIKHLQSKGHKCRVLLHSFEGYLPAMQYDHDTVEVFPMSEAAEIMVRHSDAVFCQLSYTSWAMNIANIYRKPCYHIAHSKQPNEQIKKDLVPINIIYNSDNLKEELGYNHPSIVVRPITRKFEVKDPVKNKFITLINCGKHKGAELFVQLAKKMPEQKFLAVKGTYSDQVEMVADNITVMNPTTDMQSVYDQTRVLLMPSEYESYGMTASEAMFAGLPVIASENVAGLKENCGDSAIYCPTDNIERWAGVIKHLAQKKDYLSASNRSLSRALFNEQRSAKDLENLEIFLKG